MSKAHDTAFKKGYKARLDGVPRQTQFEWGGCGCAISDADANTLLTAAGMPTAAEGH